MHSNPGRHRPRLFGSLAFASLGTLSCGTDAVGVSACQKIEAARCEAAQYCGDRFGIEDVEACKRFYDVQCLHGFAADDSPGTPQINQCIGMLEAARDCAKDGGEDASCDDIVASAGDSITACDAVANPENTEACAFLNPSPVTDDDSSDDDSAGNAGTAGQSSDAAKAGSGGMGGAAENAGTAGTTG